MSRSLVLLALTWLLLLLLAGWTVSLAAPHGPVWLGNPIADEAYSARHIWDLQVWRGRVYLGYGDWTNNLGPVDIWYYSPTVSAFFSESVYVSPERPAARVDDESIDRYVAIGDDLYIPGTDPRDPWDFGNFYRNDGSGWVKYRTIPDGIHAFDMAGYDGDLFAAIGPNENAAVQRSGDGGLTWTPALSEVGYTRFYEMFELGDTLFAVKAPTEAYSKPVVYGYDKLWFLSTTVELVPDRPTDWVFVRDGVFPFGDVVLYVPWFWNEAAECTKPVPALYQAQLKGDGAHVPFFDGKHPRDLVVTGGRAFVLDAGASRCIWTDEPPDPAGYTATIYASSNLAAWYPAATAHLTDTPNALEVLDGRAYVGTYNGGLYALDLALPSQWYLPLVFRPANANSSPGDY